MFISSKKFSVVLGLGSILAFQLAMSAVVKSAASSSTPQLEPALIEHMSFQGYQIDPTKQSKTQTAFKHSRYPNISVKPRGDGYLLGTWYHANPNATLAERNTCLQAVNRMNALLMASRLYIDDVNDMAFEAYYPGRYNKTSFNDFISQMHNDESILTSGQYVDDLQKCFN